MHSRMLRFASAAVILIAGTLGIVMFSSTENSAYAEVIQMLQQARTLVYTLVTQANDPAGQTVVTQWQFKDPAYLRTTTEGGHVTVIDGTQGRQLSLVPETKGYIAGEFELSGGEGEDAFAVVKGLRALPAQADKTLGETVLNGRLAKGYRVTRGDATTTVWIDSGTRELVQVEQTYASAPGMNYVMTDFQFDALLDDSLFDLTPPLGYNKIADLVANGMGSEETFVGFLKVWCTELAKDRTFPPIVLGPQLSKVMMDMATQGKFHNEKMSQLNPQEMYEAFLWVARLPKETNWRYLGANVTYGDSATPIFWYQPAGQLTYRVVYADLSIQEVLPEDLPK